MKKLKIKNVALIYKRSVYQKFFIEEKNPKLHALFEKKHFTVKSMRGVHETHANAVKTIQNYLKKMGIACTTETRHLRTNFDDVDLVITLGGDGTFLRTAHFAKDKHILPVNSDPTQSVGALCSTTVDNFKEKFDEVLAGNYRIKEMPLMQIRLNGKILPIEAINDALFTNISPAATSRYYIKLGKFMEEHKSSGVWISTATGSTAAISAAGGEKMIPSDDRLQFATREPYQGIFHPYRLTRGYIEKNQKLILINRMIQAKIYIDGPTNSYDLEFGDEVEFRVDKKKLKVIA